MRAKKQTPWFTTKKWEELTKEEQQTHQLREEFYQLAVHYVLQSGTPTVTASMIKRLYVPMHVGNWKMSPNYQAAKDVLERMVQEHILRKVSKPSVGVSDLYFYEVIKQRAPFPLAENLQQVISDIHTQEEKKFRFLACLMESDYQQLI